MDSKTRLETAWEHKEPDRVPIELVLSPRWQDLPEATGLIDFSHNEADNFIATPVTGWPAFFDIESEQSEEIIEDRPGEYRKKRIVHKTEAGEFYAITRHSYPDLDDPDFHWERRFIDTLDDMRRLAEAPRRPVEILKEEHLDALKKIGNRGVAFVPLFHPLGTLVRRSNMEEVYIWLMTEGEIIHQYLEAANTHVVETIEAIGKAGLSPVFMSWAHEMLIPPWMGMAQFDEFVYPYDKQTYDTIHKIGGRMRAHCHGNCMQYLEKMSEMGIDSIEPLEMAPFGDVVLAEAKRLVGDKMLLSGNIPSQAFLTMTADEVYQHVKNAMDAAKKGGGFTLRCTGGYAGSGGEKNDAQRAKLIENITAYIKAGLKYGQY